jgi:hypothetical protein
VKTLDGMTALDLAPQNQKLKGTDALRKLEKATR